MKLLVGIALLAYLVVAVARFSKGENTNACRRVEIAVSDSSRAAFISDDEVRSLLEQKHLYPEGIPMNRIDLKEMEQALEAHQFILQAQCYKTADNVVHVKVSQRLPVMRILSDEGGDYFIDAHGKPLRKVKYPADVVLATGAVSRHFAEHSLAPIGCYLQQNEFWNNQILQIHVLADSTLEVIPRVGNHIVYLGEAVDVEQKLGRLKVFYEEALNNVGWNKYSKIDLQFNNQIICTKKE